VGSGFEQAVFKELKHLRDENKQILGLIGRHTYNVDEQARDQLPTGLIPVQTEEELNKLEDWLTEAENRETLVSTITHLVNIDHCNLWAVTVLNL